MLLLFDIVVPTAHISASSRLLILRVVVDSRQRRPLELVFAMNQLGIFIGSKILEQIIYRLLELSHIGILVVRRCVRIFGFFFVLGHRGH